MKSGFMFGVAVLAATAGGMVFADAEVSLRLPLTTSATITTKTGKVAKNQNVLASKFNVELKRAGEKGDFPNFVTIHSKTEKGELAANEDDVKTWSDITSRFEDESSKLKGNDKGLDIGASIPDDLTTSDHKNQVCYEGDPTKVSALITALADSVFSEQINVWAWKYKKKQDVDNEVAEQDMPELWKDWRGTGEAVLVLTSYGDDGDDVETNLIYKCGTQKKFKAPVKKSKPKPKG